MRDNIHSDYDNNGCSKMKKALLSISLIISSIVLLYLLFINIYRDTFILTDWVVVTVDLSAKTIIDIILLCSKD